MRDSNPKQLKERQYQFDFVGFAISDCVIALNGPAARFLHAVHRTALEVSVQNLFGLDLGGFWLMIEQIEQLRRLADHYPATESQFVSRAVEEYLQAQLQEWYGLLRTHPFSLLPAA